MFGASYRPLDWIFAFPQYTKVNKFRAYDLGFRVSGLGFRV